MPDALGAAQRWTYLLMLVAAMALVGSGLLYLLIADYRAWLVPLKVVDRQTMVVLNFDGGAVGDRFFYGYSQLRTWLPLAAVTVAYTLGWQHGSWRDRLALALAITLMLAFTDQLTSSVIKPLVARPRPSHDMVLAPLLHYVGGYRGGHYGFVSSHAANIFALCTLLAYVYRSRVMRGVLVLFAVTMGYSRIYLGVHFPGDVVCGALIGVAAAAAVVALCPPHLLTRHDCTPWGIVLVWMATSVVLLV